MMWKGFVAYVLVMLCWPQISLYAAGPDAQQYFRDGYLAATAREWDEAIELYTKAINLDNTNPETYLQRAAAHQMAGHIDLAIKDYEQAVRLKPDYYLALEYLAKLYESKGNYDKAVSLYVRALPLVKDPKWRSVVKWWLTQAKNKSRRSDVRSTRRIRTRSR